MFDTKPLSVCSAAPCPCLNDHSPISVTIIAFPNLLTFQSSHLSLSSLTVSRIHSRMESIRHEGLVARIIDIAICRRTVTASEPSEAAGCSWSDPGPFSESVAGSNAFPMSVQFVHAGLLNGMDVQTVVAIELHLSGAVPFRATDFGVFEADPAETIAVRHPRF